MNIQHPLFLVILGVVFGYLTACSSDNQPLTQLDGITMGTTYSIKIIGLPDDIETKGLHKRIKEKLAEINASMSTYEQDSEISKINQYQANSPIPLSEPLFAVIKEASRISQLSSGAFDITVGPLVNLWGFGPEAQLEQIPSTKKLIKTKTYTGMDKIILDHASQQIQKRNPDVYLDLSAIAKGYAVDELTHIIEGLHIKNYMVEIGGELRVRGLNQRDTAWRIAIEKPDPEIRQALYVIEPGNLAVATSGDYRNYFEQDGVRFSHTINPKTGKPIAHNLASVTVLNEKSMTADALATTFMVLGPDAGLQLAEQQHIAALFLVKTADGFEARISTQFKPYYQH